MYEEQQETMPSLTSYPSPNPNPNPPHADASLQQYSHGFDGSEAQPAFELDGAAASQTEMNSQTADSTTFEQPAGNLGDVANNVANTTSQLEPVQCEVCNITCNSKEVYEIHTHGKKHMKNMQKIAISSVIGPKVTPITATATSVGELENKKQMLLQNGASVDSLLYCQICNVVSNNQDGHRAHLAGKKHSSKAAMQNMSTNDVINPTSNQDPLRCDLCKISCTSFELLNSHMSGKKHQKKLKESMQLPDQPLTFVTSSDTPTIKYQESTTEGKSVISQDVNNNNPVSCELCGISCNTYEVFKTHLSGKKHQKNLEKSEKLIGPNPVNEEGKDVNMEGGERKTKREGGDEDLEAKRRKILEGGAALDGLRTCTVCNIVCSSPAVYFSHLAGKKHAAMAVKAHESGMKCQET